MGSWGSAKRESCFSGALGGVDDGPGGDALVDVEGNGWNLEGLTLRLACPYQGRAQVRIVFVLAPFLYRPLVLAETNLRVVLALLRLASSHR